MRVETRTIVGQDGNALVINASDFDADKHKLFDEAGSAPQEAPQTAGTVPAAEALTQDANGNRVAPGDGGQQVPAPAVPPRFVSKDGTRHFVVDASGARVEADGIDPAGYKSDKEAWTAINKAAEPKA